MSVLKKLVKKAQKKGWVADDDFISHHDNVSYLCGLRVEEKKTMPKLSSKLKKKKT
jgi:hypothetical protein